MSMTIDCNLFRRHTSVLRCALKHSVALYDPRCALKHSVALYDPRCALKHSVALYDPRCAIKHSVALYDPRCALKHSVVLYDPRCALKHSVALYDPRCVHYPNIYSNVTDRGTQVYLNKITYRQRTATCFGQLPSGCIKTKR